MSIYTYRALHGAWGKRESVPLLLRPKLTAMQRWFSASIYVTDVKGDKLSWGHPINKNGGASIAVRKQGGWGAAFALACKMAGWGRVELHDAKPAGHDNEDVD